MKSAIFKSLLLPGVCLRLLAGNAVGAADPGMPDVFVTRSWGTEAGLPQNTVNAIIQTREGYLWLGTQGGLARFDGVRFTTWGLTDGLPNDQVRTLLEDAAGNLWIGTAAGGLGRLRNGRLEVISVERGLASVNVTSLEQDSQGRLWIGTTAGLSVWQDEKLLHLPPLDRLGRVLVRTVFEDRAGTIWISTAQGLFEFREGQLTECPGTELDPRLSPYCLLEDRAGNLWASIGNGKVLRRTANAWTTFSETNGLPFAYVTSLAEGADGTIWAGSLDQGLYFFRGDRFLPVQQADKYASHAVRSLLADREGNLWVGTRTAGLGRVSRPRLQVIGAAQGLTNDFVRGIAESADGALWVATTGGGLYRGMGGQFAPFTNATLAQGFPFVESVIVTRAGELCWGSGGALFQWREDRLTSHTRGQVAWLANAGVTALHEDVTNGLWIGTTEGRLLRLRDGEFESVTNHSAQGAITALTQSPDGTLWVGSAGSGLTRRRPDGFSAFTTTNGLLSNQIRTLHLDSDGTLWVGTSGGGLSRLREGQWFNFTTRQGLGDDTVSQILEDDEGRLWLGCNRGIFRVRKSDLAAVAKGTQPLLRSRAFGLADGMPVEECSSGFSPAGLRLRSGKLGFATGRGVILLDPRQPDAAAPPPRVLVQEALVNGQVQPFGASDDAGQPNQAPVRLIIPPGHSDIEFHYTGLSFAAPEKVHFRFRLEGYDEEWIEARTRRAAYYPRLPPGEFTFRVTACNADGVWSESAATLAVTVRPRFWETGWFLAASVVGGLGVIGGAIRLVERRKYRRRLARLEMQHAIERERLRISQDMHDDVGSILTRVSILSDVAQGESAATPAASSNFARIGAHVRAAVQSLDEIVWATNPHNDNLPRFAEYVGRFADECFENTKLRCWQDIPPDLPNLPLRAEVRHNVFLAVKEALNNALKHSGATEVWVRLRMEGEEVRLTIEDNGGGFDPATAPPGGNGLANMKSRLVECGGHWQVQSAPGQGTRIRFDFTLPRAE